MSNETKAVRDDEAVRRRIGPWAPSGVPDLSDFDASTNFVVRAAAGSGKTTALVGRMVALVRSGVPVEDLTAITFTRKAAGEMSARFSRELEEARRDLPKDSAEYRRVVAALGNVQSTFIGTIHAFCSRLLRERPLDAGLPPDFTAGLSDRDERQLRERAWHEHLQALHDGDGDHLDQLSDCGLEAQKLASFFQRLCRFPDLEPFTDGADEPPEMDAAVAAVREKIREWSEYRPDQPVKGSDAVMKAFDKAERMVLYLGMDAPAQKAEFLSVIANVSDTDRASVKTTYWKGENVNNSSWAKILRDELLPDLIRSTVQPVLREWEAHVHRVAVACTAPAVERYHELRRREGMLTFHDLLSLTRDMLRDRPDVLRDVQERYPRLLVDEFQDTDPLQAEILSFLASNNPEETDWRACRPRDGSLFIVGDDKQSIYRFRRADKDVFEAFRQRIDDEPNGEAVDLTKNFRSRAPICTWCNDVFGDLFGDEAFADVQAEYVDFDPQRPAGPEHTSIRRKPVDAVKGNYGSRIARQDAEQIARFIQVARAGDAEPEFYHDEEGAVFRGEVRFSDFLILTRVRTRLSEYTDALARHGIPYTVTGSRDMSDSEELKAIVDVLRAALRPDDPVDAVAYLKGLLVGASDDDLYRYAMAGGSFSAFGAEEHETAIDQLDEERGGRLQDAAEQLEAVRTIVHDTRPGVGIEQLIDRTGLLAGATHPEKASEASTRAGAVMRLLHVVQAWGSDGLGWSEVVEELDLVLQGEEEMDGMTLETGQDDAVRIMNVHQAKGLEAPVVFLADPYTRGSSPTPEQHVRREHDDVVVPVIQGEGVYSKITHAPRGWHEDNERSFISEEQRIGEAEEHRLLYVAATRAERLLVVSTYPKKAGAGYWGALHPYLTDETAPVLDIPERDASESTTVEASAPDLDGARAHLEARIEAGAQKSYDETRAASDEAESSSGAAGAPGYGRALGNALHACLELLVEHRTDPPSLTAPMLRQVLEAEGILRLDRSTDATVEERVETLQRMVDSFRASWIWDEIEEASDVRTEYRFAHMTASDEGPDELTRGQVDLLYQTDDGWTVIDFKSDRLDPNNPATDAKKRAEGKYSTQVEAYVAAWRRLQGEEVDHAGIWFADADAFVSVVQSPDTTGPAESER
ncbi:ATP-dependent DNA helicase [Longibacter salinarum]|uniref:DNA 3'-5' helicase n=1 Tax=Longibacter salinarum TaxID=1850348 RepID=A0A2A8D071_9BACT|nr:UvrD-helicase domain-containing protein [Longibacter salinarum]PEN14270.1 ATP-dependent DNA helicase [Longibacter salinarum]